MRTAQLLATTLALAVAPAVTPAARAQSAIPVRSLAPITTASRDTFGAILNIRELPGGRVMVNDARRRRVVLLDQHLVTDRVVLDSAGGAANAYGPRQTPIISYVGDSSLFVDITAQSLLVIDPDARVVRAIAAPRSNDIFLMGGSASTSDAAGRLVYRGMGAQTLPPATPGGPPQVIYTSSADTAPLVRANFATRTIDTVTLLKGGTGTKSSTRIDTDGTRVIRSVAQPLVFVDEWAVLANGTVAVVRGHDYHVDFFAMDGTRTASPKLPFDWRRLSDADKQRVVDSVRAVLTAPPQPVVGGGGSSPASGGGRGGGGGGGGMAVASGGGTTAGAPAQAAARFERDVVPPEELPDYYPPLRAGAVRADLDGNIWILPTTSAQSTGGELVYDVVNQRGELHQRVRVPKGTSIAGFGREGAVYLMSGSLATGFTLHRTSIAK